MHEEPQVPNYGRRGTGMLLKNGLCIAIEPMITLGKRDISMLSDNWTIVTRDGKPAAHYEHTVCVRKGKADILSSFDEIEKVFMNLQAHHRSYEKELNYLKADLKESVTKLNHELHEEYNTAYEAWSTACNDYNEETRYLQQQLKDFKLQELDRVANLRIAIPNELKEIFELVKTCDSAK
jgi:hypothetical protein